MIQINIHFFYKIALYGLIRQFIQKYINVLAKNQIDIVFKICLDSKFPIRVEILKKCPP